MKKSNLIVCLLGLSIPLSTMADNSCKWYLINNRTSISTDGADQYNVSYPYFSGDCLEHANTALDYTTQTIKDQFILNESGRNSNEGVGNQLNVNYQFLWISPSYISLQISVLTYLAGQAHPVTTFQTLNYDMDAQKVLKLEDLFNEGSQYLPIFVKESRKQLEETIITTDAEKESAQKWIEKGTQEKLENYAAWSLTQEGIMFTFDPGKVADYAQGKQDATVSYSKLKGMLKPEVLENLSVIFETQASA